MRDPIFKYGGLLLLLSIMFFACDDKYDPNVVRETTISELLIANGGADGKQIYESQYYADENRFIFENVSAESDLRNIKFSGLIAVGAAPEFATYDFLEKNPQVMKVFNREEFREYSIYLEILEPKMDPLLEKVFIVVEKDGETIEVPGIINNALMTLELDAKDQEYVRLKSFMPTPKHAKVEFTALADGKIQVETPGKVLLDHMGRKSEYEVKFTYIPPTGIIVGEGIVYDYSKNPNSKGILGGFAIGNMTRTTAFDATGVFISSGKGGAFAASLGPSFISLNDVIANNKAGLTYLSVTNVNSSWGWTAISAGSMSQGHMYTTNMSTINAAPLQLATWGANPSVDGTIVGKYSDATNQNNQRYGDNLCIDLDKDGNGYLLAARQDASKLMTIKVANFVPEYDVHAINDVSGHLDGDAGRNPWSSINNVQIYNENGETTHLPEYTFTAKGSSINLINISGQVIGSIPKASLKPFVSSARVYTYNNARYILMTAETAASGEMYLYDISEGDSTAKAFENFAANKGFEKPVYTYNLGTYTGYGTQSSFAAIGEKMYIYSSTGDAGFIVVEFPIFKEDK